MEYYTHRMYDNKKTKVFKANSMLFPCSELLQLNYV